MKSVVFTAEFADKAIGEKFTCDSMLASHLVNVDKVAIYAENIESEEFTEPIQGTSKKKK